jgi:hypothetical protein
METNNTRDSRVDDQDFQAPGMGLDALIRVPLFIIVGFVVVVWEAVNRVLRTVLQQGGPFTAGAPVETRVSGVAPTPVKVPMMPIDNYSQLDAEEVIARLDTLEAAELAIVRNYEIDHGNRQSVLAAIEQRLTRTH